MADRVTVQALIDANLPDNTTEEITPAKHREVETSLNDNSFNKDSDTAVNVNYSPTSVNFDWLPEGDPTEVGGGLDILAARTGSNPSNDIAYVSNNGSDVIGEFEIGNSEKPFLTINAAITAIPANGIVKVLGGSYVESVVIDKDGATLDISGCSVTGRIGFNKNNITIIATGATITGNTTSFLLGNFSGSHSNFKVIGGNWSALNGDSLNLGVNVTNVSIQFATFTSNTSGIANNILSKETKISNCIFTTTVSNPTVSVTSAIGDVCEFVNCEINSSTSALNILNGKVKLQNCEVIGANIGISGSVSNGFATDLIANSCKIKGTASYGLRLTESCNNVQITNCQITGGTNCVEYVDVNRSNGVNNIFQNNIFYAGSGDIFTDTTPNGGDLGTTEVLGGTFAKTPILIPTYVNVSTTTLIVNGLQEVS